MTKEPRRNDDRNDKSGAEDDDEKDGTGTRRMHRRALAIALATLGPRKACATHV